MEGFYHLYYLVYYHGLLGRPHESGIRCYIRYVKCIVYADIIKLFYAPLMVWKKCLIYERNRLISITLHWMAVKGTHFNITNASARIHRELDLWMVAYCETTISILSGYYTYQGTYVEISNTFSKTNSISWSNTVFFSHFNVDGMLYFR